jgi:hypothetical protein
MIVVFIATICCIHSIGRTDDAGPMVKGVAGVEGATA